MKFQFLLLCLVPVPLLIHVVHCFDLQINGVCVMAYKDFPIHSHTNSNILRRVQRNIYMGVSTSWVIGGHNSDIVHPVCMVISRYKGLFP